ncbi:DUF4013 domain-containing protein [Variovorax sp. MHTC-1]|uniref:DUF4013 domain-containing protein n=1 Tax=Variovorax sp. MHTC-1 TaxID=2495593 RepID=UPI000F896B75|nr:DUF4013 domain-containing protein [Variovorax sp. MHTC-1]RST52118.1 hypothetical protein EJI01_16490 [Variovorax sp. MHTC-1]
MQEQTSPAPRPFWHRLNTFFAFPFQLQPLGYAVLLALSSLLFHVLFFLPQALGLLLVELGIILAASRYGFKVMALGARGIVRASDFPRSLEDEWTNLPWKLFALLILQGIVAGLVGAWSPALGYVALFVLSFTLPATTMVLVQSGSFWQALNPGYVWETIRAVGWPYALLCVFLFLLNSGAQIAIVMLLPVMSGWFALPAINFVMIYFGWVMASLLGYVMYQNHAELGIDLLPGAGADDRAPDTRTPAQVAQQITDSLVAQMVTDGDIAGALALAYEEQRTQPEDLVAQRRYHRILLLAPDKTATLLDHGRRLIAMLLARDLASEALKVYKACREKDAGFVLEDPLGTMALARAEWRNGEAKASLALLSGFDKRFRGHTAIPQAYELAARVLVQGLDRRDMAQPILTTLEARYPESEQTQEVRWLLREVPQG